MKRATKIKIVLFFAIMHLGPLRASEEAKFGIHDILTNTLNNIWVTLADITGSEALNAVAFTGFLGFHGYLYLSQWVQSQQKLLLLKSLFEKTKEHPTLATAIVSMLGIWGIGWKLYINGEIKKRKAEQEMKKPKKTTQTQNVTVNPLPKNNPDN